MKNISFYNKWIFEFMSIAFAVILALMINQWQDNRNHEKLAKKSLENIKVELIGNKEIMEEMIEEHTKALEKIDSILYLMEKNIETSDDQVNVNFNLIGSTAWETAKLTQAISFMDIEVVSEVSGIYKFQTYYEGMVRNYVNENIFKKPKSRNKEFLEIIRSFVDVILPVEKDLVTYYTYLIDELLTE